MLLLTCPVNGTTENISFAVKNSRIQGSLLSILSETLKFSTEFWLIIRVQTEELNEMVI